MRLADDLREFVGLLLSKKVEFLIVGAYALAFHKTPRYTGDIDIFVNNSAENAARIIEALKDFGFGSLGLTNEDFESGDQVVQLGIAPNRIDLLTKISGVSFEEAWPDRQEGELDGLHVPFLSAPHMVRNKLSSARDKDLVDAKKLQRWIDGN
jgi:hypothetical protein